MFQVRIDGLEQIDQLVAGIQRRIEDQRDFWPFAAELTEDKVRDIFSTSGYGSWEPLKPETLEGKYPETRLLVNEGNYFQAATDRDSIGNTYSFDRNSMEYGIDGRYFEARFGYNYPAAHEYGRGVPQREVFGLIPDEPFINEIVVAAETRIEREIARLT